jgi:Skp family chaperone for outer membrane proteins
MKRGLIAVCFAALGVSGALAQQKKSVPPPPKAEDKVSNPAAVEHRGGTATINIQQAIFGSKEGKQLTEALTKEFEPKRADVNARNDALTSLKNAQGSSQEIAAKQRDIDATVQSYQKDYQAKQQAIAQDILQKMAPIIVKFAEVHGYGVLLDSSKAWPESNLLWSATSADVTKAIIEAYDAATQCDALDKGVQIEDARPTGAGHCEGESDFWFTNTSAQAMDCAIIFHKSGRFDPASVLTFSLKPGEKSGGTGKISTCGADSGEMQYQCFAHSEYGGATCTAQIQWR